MGKALARAGEGEVIVILGASHDPRPVLRQAGRQGRLSRVTVPKVKEMTAECGEGRTEAPSRVNR